MKTWHSRGHGSAPMRTPRSHNAVKPVASEGGAPSSRHTRVPADAELAGGHACTRTCLEQRRIGRRSKLDAHGHGNADDKERSIQAGKRGRPSRVVVRHSSSKLRVVAAGRLLACKGSSQARGAGVHQQTNTGSKPTQACQTAYRRPSLALALGSLNPSL
eukprot:360469-Chlamydomonas_euryale.AAC.6